MMGQDAGRRGDIDKLMALAYLLHESLESWLEIEAKVRVEITTIVDAAVAEAVKEREDCIRDMAHATGPHAPGCYTCKQAMKRHADTIAAALRGGPPASAPQKECVHGCGGRGSQHDPTCTGQRARGGEVMQYTLEQAERNLSDLRAKLAHAEQRVAGLEAYVRVYAQRGDEEAQRLLTPPPATQHVHTEECRTDVEGSYRCRLDTPSAQEAKP